MSSLKVPITEIPSDFPVIAYVEVVAYDKNWPALFTEEAGRFSNLLGDEVVDIQHAGSTSIPGLFAKPVIDLLVIVNDIERIQSYYPALEQAGYKAWGEWGIRGRRFFTKVTNGVRSHNFHVFGVGHIEIKRMLDFRDYLRTNPAAAREYAELKDRLARQFRNEIDRYTEGKTEFIERIIRLSRGEEVEPPDNG